MTSLVLLLSPALASTLSVDPSDSSAYATIQDAIDSAASGDVVEVVSGTFTECIDTSGLDLTIIGDGATSTIIAFNSGGAFLKEGPVVLHLVASTGAAGICGQSKQ